MRLVWVNKYNKKGILMIEEKPINQDSCTLNNVMLEDGTTSMLMDNDFNVTEEIEDD